MAKKQKLSAAEIEKLYDAGESRLTQDKLDFLLPQINDFVKEKRWVNLRPEYQRRLVWDRKKKSLLIESLLMNVPIPPVFLYESDLNRYEVMDGQQRLNTVMEFYENQFSLTGLETWDVLNGFTYAKCPPRIQRGLDRRRLSATVLLAEHSKNGKRDFIRREVFERLNTGGQQLNAQELRNSLYSGDFNDLLIRLAGNRLFDEIWKIPPYEENYIGDFISPELANNKLFKRMQDCEIVLRFFAFRRTTKIRGAVRKILDECMSDYISITKSEIADLERRFLGALQIADKIFTPHTFEVMHAKGAWRPSQPLFDAVMIALDMLNSQWPALLKARGKIKTALRAELRGESSYEIIVGKPNTANAIKERINLIHNLLKKAT